jgi:hypothetical protein
MALIEIYHVVADMYDVDPDWTNAEAIIEGQWVALESVSGSIYAKRADGTDERIIGIAGDTMSNTTSGTPYATAVLVNPAGNTRQTENRVSDMFNETLASGKITVYNAGGKFATDQVRSGVTFTVGQALYCDAAGNTTNADAGNAQIVGICVDPVSAYPSGVPGTDVEGSISLGNYLTILIQH